MTESTTARRYGGRHAGETPKKAKGGKGRVLSANITQETRDALEEEAERTGRSISQVAERWLDDARKGRADLIGMLGGMKLAPAIVYLVDVAREVEERGKDLPPSLLRFALVSAWTAAAPEAIPMAWDADIQRVLAADGEARSAAMALYQALEAHAHLHDDPVIMRARAPLYPPIEVGLLAGSSGPPLAAELQAYGEGRGAQGNAARALSELAAAGDTCAEEVRIARAAIDRQGELWREYEPRAEQARALGEGVAHEYAIAASKRGGV